MKRPNSCVNLIKAINAISKGGDPVRLSRAMANVVVGQMLPDGVVKGGSSLMFRYGAEFTRYTRDVDTARKIELEAYLEKLEQALDDIRLYSLLSEFVNALFYLLNQRLCLFVPILRDEVEHPNACDLVDADEHRLAVLP